VCAPSTSKGVTVRYAADANESAEVVSVSYHAQFPMCPERAPGTITAFRTPNDGSQAGCRRPGKTYSISMIAGWFLAVV